MLFMIELAGSLPLNSSFSLKKRSYILGRRINQYSNCSLVIQIILNEYTKLACLIRCIIVSGIYPFVIK